MNDATPIREMYALNGAEKLYVRTAGNPNADDVLILIHGGPGLSHLYLRNMQHQLASERLMVVCYDQRGCARSVTTTIQDGIVAEQPDKVPEKFDLLSYAQDLEAVRCTVAEGKKIHLLAHSWGGAVAMSYAIQYPEHVRSLLLIDSLPPTWSGLQAGYVRLHTRIQALQQQGIIPTELSADPKESLAQILPAYAPVIDASMIEIETTPGIYAQTWKAVKDFDLREELAPLNLPVLVFFGREDPFGAEWTEETQTAMANAQVTMKLVPNCGHFGWIEFPDIFYPTIRDFLAQNS